MLSRFNQKLRLCYDMSKVVYIRSLKSLNSIGAMESCVVLVTFLMLLKFICRDMQTHEPLDMLNSGFHMCIVCKGHTSITL